MNLCMDPCLVAEVIHVLFPMHICYTKPPVPSLRLCLCPARPLWFCVGVCNVVLGPVCSQCLWGAFLLLQLLQVFADPLSSAFPSWPLEEPGLWTSFIDGSAASPRASNGFVIRGRIGNEERQGNIEMEFFSLWSGLNWSKRVTLFQAGIMDETAIIDGIEMCSGIEMGPKMLKSIAEWF